MFTRPTKVLIDREALVHNFHEVLRLAGPDCPVAPVIKSDAYGHGFIGTARELLRAGADRFAVSFTEEGLQLREEGISVPILVLGGCYPAQAREIVAGKLTPMVSGLALAKALNEAASSTRTPVKIHIKVETGLGRLGIPAEDIPAFLQKLKGFPFVEVEGIGSSFSSVTDFALAGKQVKSLESVCAEATRFLGKPVSCHIAHTGGLLLGLTRPGWLIRPGIMLYGYTRGLPFNEAQLRPVLTWRTEVFKIQQYPVGYPISYGGEYRTKQGSRIALLPVGYSDGLLRSYMGRGEVLIRGKRAPFIGRFSMDWTMVEARHIPEAQEGDEVILIGKQQNEKITADEMAERAGTIIDEIFVSIAKRVPRIFEGS
jgi:alanine racemase